MLNRREARVQVSAAQKGWSVRISVQPWPCLLLARFVRGLKRWSLRVRWLRMVCPCCSAAIAVLAVDTLYAWHQRVRSLRTHAPALLRRACTGAQPLLGSCCAAVGAPAGSSTVDGGQHGTCTPAGAVRAGGVSAPVPAPSHRCSMSFLQSCLCLARQRAVRVRAVVFCITMMAATLGATGALA